MKKMSNNDKINLIKKYYRKTCVFLDLLLLNYEGYNLYITLNYFKKDDYYRLSWFNLDNIQDNNIEKNLCCVQIQNDVIDMINSDFSKYIVSSQYEDKFITE